MRLEFWQIQEHWKKLYARRLLIRQMEAVLGAEDREEIRAQVDELTYEIDDMVAWVEDAVAHVPDAVDRIACRHRYVNGETWQEVADALGGGISPDAVYQMCTRAIKKQCFS